MPEFKSWIKAARPRTLPLSISGILVGTALAGYYGSVDYIVFCLALLTTIGFQITSNFANDYGDGVKGTDNDKRIGPKRVIQSGLITAKELKRGIIISVVICLLLVFSLLFTAFGMHNMLFSLVFLLLGFLSIWAALKYTLGESAYGYHGLGDLFVFIFFGLVGVIGSMFLYIKEIPPLSLLPAVSMGLLSVGVLNLNNLRDYESDKDAGKNTIIVKIGFLNGKVYHYFLLIISFICLLFFVIFTYQNWLQFSSLLAYIPIFIHLIKIKSTNIAKNVDPELKKLALSTFLMAILFYFSYNIFL
ncbi:1,4-dihydroxy-2-naphthoate octaprenyltransferase [Maribacter sp. CXY002]|uniref:1,4-dihydroxy-2-naphthoate octaprenyltransferase n=1 Tax=Maribacter luteocoastalis TaxID=3407671 RepID=UPI003B66DC13